MLQHIVNVAFNGNTFSRPSTGLKAPYRMLGDYISKYSQPFYHPRGEVVRLFKSLGVPAFDQGEYLDLTQKLSRTSFDGEKYGNKAWASAVPLNGDIAPNALHSMIDYYRWKSLKESLVVVNRRTGPNRAVTYNERPLLAVNDTSALASGASGLLALLTFDTKHTTVDNLLADAIRYDSEVNDPCGSLRDRTFAGMPLSDIVERLMLPNAPVPFEFRQRYHNMRRTFIDFGTYLDRYGPKTLYDIAGCLDFGTFGCATLLAIKKECPAEIKYAGKKLGSCKILPENIPKNFIHLDGCEEYDISLSQYNVLGSIDSYILPVPMGEQREFVVKIVVMDRQDFDGVSLVRVKLSKLPMVQNLATMYGDTMFDDNRDLYSKITAVKVARANPLATRREVNAAFNEYAKAANAPPKVAVPPSRFDLGYADFEENVNGLTLHRKLNGRLLSFYEKLKVDPLIVKDMSKTIPRKVLNKVVLNFMNAPVVDAALVKTCAGYIVNAVPEVDVVNEVMPALAYAVKDTVAVAGYMVQLVNSKDVNLMNAFNKGQIKITAANWREAFSQGELISYLGMKFRDLFNLNEMTAVNAGQKAVGSKVSPFPYSH